MGMSTTLSNRRPRMALTIPEIVRQFKVDVAKAISAETIMKICGYLEYVCRERVLGPVTTVHVFLLQIFHGNTACTALSRLAEVPFTAAAYCKARGRLPLALFEDLLERVCDASFAEVHTTGRWRGHRTWTLDGSSFSMPDTPALRTHFGQPSAQAKGCGFPVAHMLALFHTGTGLLLRVLASPMCTHDMRHAAMMHAELDEGDILIAIEVLPRSRIWLCFLCGKCMGSSAATKSRLLVFGWGASIPDPANHARAGRARGTCVVWDGRISWWNTASPRGSRVGWRKPPMPLCPRHCWCASCVL